MNTVNVATSVTLTIPNPTMEQLDSLHTLVNSWNKKTRTTETNEAAPKGRRGRPAKTVSEDEDEDFGTDEITTRNLSSDDGADSDEETEYADTDESDETEDEEDSEPTVDFTTVRNAINKFGNTNPKRMRQILAKHGIKTSKDLKAKKSLWEPVYRSVKSEMKKA